MRRKGILFVILYASLIFCYSCSSSDSTKSHNIKNNEFKKGDYIFSFSDSLGSKLIDGTMTLDTNTEKFSGSYQVTQKYVDTFQGLSTMKGILSGTYSKADNKLFINMNPKLADANVFINGKVYRDSLVGEWNFTTIMGVQMKGNFIATPKE